MVGSGPVGEAVSPWPGRTGRVLELLRLRGRLGWIWCQHPQASAVVSDASLGGFAEVVPKVPPVRHLHRLGRPGGGAFGEERCPIAADHFAPWPLREPSGQAGGFPVGQQVHRASAFDVDQDGSVVAAFAGGVLIDADDARGRNLRVGQGLDQPQHRAAADGQAEDSRYAGPGSTGEREADRGQRRPQALGPPAVSTRQPRHLLDEGAAPARDGRAEEPADTQAEDDPSAPTRHISRKPQVGAVNPPRPASTARAIEPGHRALGLDAYHLFVHVDRQHSHVCDRRKQ